MVQTVLNIVEAHPLINVSSDFVVTHPQQDRRRLTGKVYTLQTFCTDTR